MIERQWLFLLFFSLLLYFLPVAPAFSSGTGVEFLNPGLTDLQKQLDAEFEDCPVGKILAYTS